MARVELYHPARLNALQRAMDQHGGLDLRVVELSSAPHVHPVEVERKGWEFECTTLISENRRAPPRRERQAMGRLLDSLRPAVVVITGYSLPAMRMAARWARRERHVCVLASDTQRRDRPRPRWKELPKGWWIRRHVDGAFVGGSRSAAYLNRLGLPQASIWRGYDVVDNEGVARAAEVTRAEEETARSRLSLPASYFLFVGRLVPEKNVGMLLHAYARYRTRCQGRAWGLVVVGNGAERDDLLSTADRLGLEDVVWAGYRTPAEVPAYYALASALILPSVSEPWGLVVNEALACGLPVLVSLQCGCAPELVRPGVNGFLFDPSSPERLAELMSRLASPALDRERMEAAARAAVSHLTPESWARTLFDCLETTMRRTAGRY